MKILVPEAGPQFNIKMSLTNTGNPIVEIRQSYDRLISTMRFLYWYDDIFILIQPTGI